MPDETEGFEPEPLPRGWDDEGWGADYDLASLPGGPPDAAMLDRIAEMAGITRRWTCTRDELISALADLPDLTCTEQADLILANFTPAEPPRPTPGPSAAGSADGLRAGAGTDEIVVSRDDVMALVQFSIGPADFTSNSRVKGVIERLLNAAAEVPF